MSTTLPPVLDRAKAAAEYIRERIQASLNGASIGIICGSGLGGLVEHLEDCNTDKLNYCDIPWMPKPTVHGHAGQLVFGRLGASRRSVVLMVGRAHFYEGYEAELVTMPVRVLRLLGVETLIVTNACGGLNPEYSVGDVMVLNDHLDLVGLAGMHPLRGPNIDEFGVRFPAMSDAYDLEFRRLAHKAWRKRSLDGQKAKLREGVYAFAMGADVVGMSTVPEIIVARHCGMKVLAMSVVTNMSVLEPAPRGDDLLVEASTEKELGQVMEQGKASHDEVMAVGREATRYLQDLIEQIMEDLPKP
ncbi:MAG: hypothetical protein M1815_002379 [Lichina confinis]|nr:MAG: hypothetical protein M1815_002379 [Lichina confinis]